MAHSPASDDGRAVSERVVEKVAAETSTSPIDLHPPLYRSIDPEALDALFRPGRRSDFEVTFTYHGCAVTVSGAGHVEVSSVSETARSDARIDGSSEPQEVD